MPRLLFFFFAFFISSTNTVQAQSEAETSPDHRTSFDNNWRFQKDDPADAAGKLSYSVMKKWLLPTSDAFLADPAKRSVRPEGNPVDNVSYAQPDFDDSAWRQINLPHDWAIEGPFDRNASNETGKRDYWGAAWYRKHFDVPASDAGRQIFLDIDGAMSYASVWVNGQCAGGWPYGYASFRVDLTPYILPGKTNVIAIRLDNPNESSRWYPGAGIYRHVWLVETAPVHLARWGVAVTTPEVSPDSATVAIKTTVENASAHSADIQVQTSIHALASDNDVTSHWMPLTVPAQGNATASFELPVLQPRLWDLDNPFLYTVVTTVKQGDTVVDRQETVFGIRSAKFDAQAGFLLNGKHVPLHGVCLHSDLGPLGTALNTRALERQIEILKEMGCNAIRTSHNPTSPELIALCDRMGVMVMAEAFDCWETGKKPNDYHLLFDDWSEQDLRAMVRHYRNDPCVIIWSIGNEIPDQDSPRGTELAQRLTSFAHEEDPSRPTTLGCGNYASGFNSFGKGVDVMGYNYKPDGYAKWRAFPANANTPFVGTETASTVSSRGVYYFPVQNSVGFFQVSSYDKWRPGWGTLPDVEFKNQEQNPFVSGEFVWTGFDYLGEPTPFGDSAKKLFASMSPADQAKWKQLIPFDNEPIIPSRSSYFGIVDLDGFKKDRFYLYQAHWRPDFPMAHLLPHWNWPDRIGQSTPVYLYTSGDEAELFLNGQSLGRKTKGAFEYRLTWDVPYQPGKLEAVAYKNGREWARDVVQTTGSVTQMKLAPDRAALKADGQDLSYVTLTLTDKDGLPVPLSDNRVKFTLTGPADLIATDNGDATDLNSFQAPEKKVFNGMALAIIRTRKDTPGAITLKAESEGLPPVEVSLSSQ